MSLTLDDKMRYAVKLFADNNLPPNELIKRGWQHGLTEAQTRAGMVAVWERVQAGELIKPFRMAWRAWDEAKKLQADEFLNMELTREELRIRLDKANDLRRIAVWGVVISSSIAVLLAVEMLWGVL